MLRRAAKLIGKSVGLLAVFVVAVVGGILLHAGMRAPRTFALEQVNAILEGSFQGRIDLRRIEVLRLDRLGGVEADIYDPEGQRVVHVEGVSVRFGIVTIVRSLLGGGRLDIDLHDLHVRHAEVLIEDDAQGNIGLVRAFDAKEPTPADEPPSAGTAVTIRGIALDHAWIHGRLAGAPVIDVDLDGLLADFGYSPDETTIRVDALGLRARGIPGLSPRGDVVADVVLPAETTARRIRAAYDGYVGEVPVALRASLLGDDVAATVDVTETPAAAINAIAPDQLTLRAPVRAHAEVFGTLPTIDAWLDASLGDGDVSLTGVVTLPESDADAMRATAEVEITHLDLSVAQDGLPASDLDAFVAASVISHPGGAMDGDFALENRPGTVAGQVVPAAEVSGVFTERSVTGSALVHEAGAPTAILFALGPRPGAATPSLLAFDVRTQIGDLGAVRRLGDLGSGRASVGASGTIDLEAQSVDATVRAEATGVTVSGVGLDHAEVNGGVSGTFAAPRFSSQIFANGLSVEGYTFESITVGARGTPERIDVEAAMAAQGERTPAVVASARIVTTGNLRVEDGRVAVKREEVEAVAKVAVVTVLPGGGVDVRALSVEGLGAPLRADVRYAGDRLVVKARTEGIDVTRIGELLAREEEMRGSVALDVDATIDRREAHGRVQVSAKDVYVAGIDGGDAEIALALDGKQVSADVAVKLDGVGDVRVKAPAISLGGPLLSPKGILDATGDASIDGKVDVAALLERLPKDMRPLSRGEGIVTLRGNVSRPRADADPSVEVEVATSGLALTGKEEDVVDEAGNKTQGATPWHVEKIDTTVKARFEGESGRTTVAASFHDTRGALGEVAVETEVPLKEVMAPKADLTAIAGQLPMKLHIAVPRRSLEDLPGGVVKDVEGEIELRADFEGTLREPKVAVSAKAEDLRAKSGIACLRSIDVALEATYDGKKATLDVRAKTGGREVMKAVASLDLAIQDVLDAQKRTDAQGGDAPAVTEVPLAWEASGEVTVDRFPLETANAFLPQPIGGSLSGKAKVAQLHRDATLEAAFTLDEVTVERARIPTIKLTASIKDGTFGAEAKLTQRDGRLGAKISGAATWGDALAPSFDLKKPVDVALDAKNFRVAAARPFVAEVFSELDGRIDANAKLRVFPGGKDGTFAGAIVVREGVFAVPQIGERFSAVSARVVMKPWGTVRLEKLEAQGPTGRLTASAEAVFDGLAFQKADARLEIPEGESIPIAVEGVPMGRAHGNVTAKVTMSADQKRLEASVDVPMLKVELPQSTGNSVQDLAPDDKIRIGYHDGTDLVTVPLEKPEPPADPSDLAVRTEVKLGKDVQIKRDTTLDVYLRGGVVVQIADATRVSGEIRLMRGQIELQGKIFEIERGTVSFVGDDPGDPLIQATAFWDAPGDVRVYADFTGHVSEGKLTLRSTPPYSEDEILALILFGSTDGALGSSKGPKQSSGVAAVGLAGGVVTQGLNKIISGVTPDLSTRIDSSEANSPQPQIVWQITKDVTASLGYKLGVPAPGTDPDRAQLTLDWRFVRNWSLDTKVGDQGSTSVDVIWRMRY